MKVKAIEYVEWKCANKPGMLAYYAKEFKKRGVDLECLWCGDYGLAASAKNPAKLRAALKNLKAKFKSGYCVMATGANKRGALTDLLDRFAKAKVNIAAADALATGGKFSSTFCVSGKDWSRAKKFLS